MTLVVAVFGILVVFLLIAIAENIRRCAAALEAERAGPNDTVDAYLRGVEDGKR